MSERITQLEKQNEEMDYCFKRCSIELTKTEEFKNSWRVDAISAVFDNKRLNKELASEKEQSIELARQLKLVNEVDFKSLKHIAELEKTIDAQRDIIGQSNENYRVQGASLKNLQQTFDRIEKTLEYYATKYIGLRENKLVRFLTWLRMIR